MFQAKVAEKIKTYALFSIIFPGNRAFYKHNMEKYGKSRQARDGNVMLRREDANCMPGN